MPSFNYQAALKAGYTKDQIDQYLNSSQASQDINNFGAQQQAPVAPVQYQPQVPEQKSIGQQVGSGLLDFLGGMVKPVERYGRSALASVIEAPASLAAANLAQLGAMEQTPQQLRDILMSGSKALQNVKVLSDEQRQQLASKPQDFAVQQLKDTANVASYAVPAGKAGVVGKYVAPGAASAFLQSISKDNVTKEGLIGDTLLGGAAAGVLGKGGELLGKALGKGSQVAGKALQNEADSLATKAIRPSPSQVTKFEKETGEKFGQFLTSRGLEGSDATKIASYVDSLQQPFDEAVTNSNLKINGSNLLGQFQSKIAELGKSVLPSDKAKSKVLEEIAANIQNTYGTGEIPADVVTQLRRQVDDNIKNFAMDEAVKGPMNITRDVLQGAIRSEADKAGVTVGGMSVKDAGTELSKLYKLMDVADKQSNLGKGAQVIGLKQILASMAGGGVGGVPGAMAAYAGASAMQNPAVLRAGSQFASKAGQTLQTQIPGMLEKTAVNPYVSSQVGSRIPQLIGQTRQTNQGTQNETTDQSNQITPPVSMVSQSQQQPQRQGVFQITPEILQAARIKLSEGDYKKLKDVYDLQNKSGKKTLTTAASQQLSDLDTSQEYLNNITKVIKDNKNVFGPVRGAIGSSNPYDTNAQDVNGQLQTVAQIIGKSLEGGKLSDNDRKFYQQNLVSIKDTPDVALRKIENLKKLLATQRDIRAKGFENVGYSSQDIQQAAQQLQ